MSGALVFARASLIAFGATACAGARPSRAPAPIMTRSALRGAIDSMLANSMFRNAHWGVLIVDPASGDTLYSLEPLGGSMWGVDLTIASKALAGPRVLHMRAWNHSGGSATADDRTIEVKP